VREGFFIFDNQNLHNSRDLISRTWAAQLRSRLLAGEKPCSEVEQLRSELAAGRVRVAAATGPDWQVEMKKFF
jgi:hypothetical protein